MTITNDLIASQSLSLDTDGYSTERSYLVTDVSGTPETRLYNAMTQPGIPQLNDPHPILPDVRVTKVNARPQGSGSDIRVIASYSVPQVEDAIPDAQQDQINQAQVSLTTGVTSESTWFDINGEFLTVTWRGPGVFVKAFKEASVQRPQLSVNFKRIETSIPKAAILNHLGRINSVPWSGFPRQTWLCTKVDASEDKEGRYTVDYGFSYKEDDWRLELVQSLTDAQVAELPPDTETANGYAVYDVYRTSDFNALGLSF